MNSSQELASSTAMRIEAIQIARDGIEAFVNVRDTNWLKYAADYKNCWNTLNYDAWCIGDDAGTTWSYIVISANQWIRISRNVSNQFFIGLQTHNWNDNFWDTVTAWTWYIDLFEVKKDSRWFYSQSASAPNTLDNIYTREIRVDYLQADGVTAWGIKDPKMKVTAIVQWKDPATDTPRRLEISTLLTNWKMFQ